MYRLVLKRIKLVIVILPIVIFIANIEIASAANPHAVTSIGTNNITYDKNGNYVTSTIDPYRYGYDYAGRINNIYTTTTGALQGSYFYDSNGTRIWYRKSATDNTYYPTKYFEQNKAGSSPTTTIQYLYANDILVAQKISTSTTSSVTQYIHTDHLGSPSVITTASGTIAESIAYRPYGQMHVDEKSTTLLANRKFLGEYFDSSTDLSYLNARYYNGKQGRFLSQDPVFRDIGLDNTVFKQKYGKDTFTILTNPQELNSYSYGLNNPIINTDKTGQSSILAWAISPALTAAQTAIWWTGSKYLEGNNAIGPSRPASAALMKHSLSVNPGPVSINEGNQNKYGNVVDQIKGSGEYKTLVDKLTNNYSKAGSIDYNPGSPGYESLMFNTGDLFSAIHGTTATNISGKKDSAGNWNLSVNISDKYDYALHGTPKDYNNAPLFNTLNNGAFASQSNGVISNFNVSIQFKDQLKGGGDR